MVVNEMKNILETKQKIKIKIYSLEYIINFENNVYIIYPLQYDNKKNIYNSFEELLNNYTIYNESIIENIDRVSIIQESEIGVEC